MYCSCAEIWHISQTFSRRWIRQKWLDVGPAGPEQKQPIKTWVDYRLQLKSFITVRYKAYSHTRSVHSELNALQKSTARALGSCLLRNDTVFILCAVVCRPNGLLQTTNKELLHIQTQGTNNFPSQQKFKAVTIKMQRRLH